jgi:hypothetical protein
MNTALTQALIELEQHVAKDGWDHEPRLFALVDTAELIAAEPRLAAALAPETVHMDGAIGPLRAYTSIEQEDFPGGKPLDEALAAIAWPATVDGVALVLERVMLPPAAEAQMPSSEDGGDLDAWAARHPDRQEVRIAVGVLRDGSRDSALRLRLKDSDEAVLSGPNLVPNLAAALAATLHD